MIKIFPDQQTHDRYSESRNTQAIITKYANDWDGIHKYIIDHYEEGKPRDLALQRLVQIGKLSESDRNKGMNNYPLDYVLKYFIRGQIWKLLLPYRKSQKEWTKLL